MFEDINIAEHFNFQMKWQFYLLFYPNLMPKELLSLLIEDSTAQFQLSDRSAA
jgi:hypothetical protein